MTLTIPQTEEAFADMLEEQYDRVARLSIALEEAGAATENPDILDPFAAIFLHEHLLLEHQTRQAMQRKLDQLIHDIKTARTGERLERMLAETPDRMTDEAPAQPEPVASAEAPPAEKERLPQLNPRTHPAIPTGRRYKQTGQHLESAAVRGRASGIRRRYIGRSWLYQEFWAGDPDRSIHVRSIRRFN